MYFRPASSCQSDVPLGDASKAREVRDGMYLIISRWICGLLITQNPAPGGASRRRPDRRSVKIDFLFVTIDSEIRREVSPYQYHALFGRCGTTCRYARALKLVLQALRYCIFATALSCTLRITFRFPGLSSAVSSTIDEGVGNHHIDDDRSGGGSYALRGKVHSVACHCRNAMLGRMMCAPASFG